MSHSKLHVKLVKTSTLGLDHRHNTDDQCDCNCDCACTMGEIALPQLSWPLTYYLELTPECNNHCLGCGNVFIHDKVSRVPENTASPLDVAGWRAIIEQISPHVQRIKLTGGEPTLHPGFYQILSIIEEYSIPFTLFTNGRWNHSGYLLESLKAYSCCLGMLVSLHGADSWTHEVFSGVAGSFDEVCTNIRRASDIGIPLATSTVLTQHNFDKIEDIVELSKSLGARQAVFNRYIGLPLSQLNLHDDELRIAIRAINSLHKAGEKVKFGSCIPTCFAASSSRGCSAGTTFVTIDPWGNVKPCNHAPVLLGNLQQQRIEDIWHSVHVTAWEELLPDQCKSCAQFVSCHGGCRAEALLLGLDRDPLIRKPITNLASLDSAGDHLVLYENACPVPNYIERQEAFGTVLISGNHVIPSLPQYQSVLSVLDGNTTLKQILQQFGPDNLAFVGELYKRDMVALRI